MTARRTAIVLAAASLGLLPCPALAQGADAPTPGGQAGPAPKREAKPRKTHPKKASHPSARAAPTPAAGTPRIAGGSGSSGAESEAASLERRRRAFFATKPDESAPEAEAPSAGVTLGGSGGISPGMGFKF